MRANKKLCLHTLREFCASKYYEIGQVIRGGKSRDRAWRGEYAKSNHYYQKPSRRVGRAHFAQQNKTAFLLIVYKVFQFIGVNYGGREGDRPSARVRLESASEI